MGKSLVIVESPAKAKTINKYLGKDYIVKSSVGHVRDLPTAGQSTGTKKAAVVSTKGMSVEEKARIKKEKDRKALIKKMGINPYKEWEANYQILPGKEKVVSELQKLVKTLNTFISQPIWTVKEKLLRGTFARSSVVMKSATSELYLTKLQKTRFSKHLKHLVS